MKCTFRIKTNCCLSKWVQQISNQLSSTFLCTYNSFSLCTAAYQVIDFAAAHHTSSTNCLCYCMCVECGNAFLLHLRDCRMCRDNIISSSTHDAIHNIYKELYKRFHSDVTVYMLVLGQYNNDRWLFINFSAFSQMKLQWKLRSVPVCVKSAGST